MNCPLLRKVRSIVTLLVMSSPLLAQDDTRNEFWPEIDLYYRLNPTYRLFFLVAPSFSRKDNYSEGQAGAHIEMGILPIFRGRESATHDIDRFRFLRFRTGIRYAWSLPSSESSSEEVRGVVEFTPRAYLPFHILASLRNRLDLRWIEGDFSTRYRARLTLERDTEIASGYSIVPYTSAEIFHDSRFKDWSRVRYQFGVTFPVVQSLALEAYYLRQEDWYAQPAHVNAYGLMAILYF